MSREQAAYFVWKHSQNSSSKRYEISKAGSITYLISLLDKGEVRAKYFCVGAILCLVTGEKEGKDNLDLFTGAGSGARNIHNLAELLLGDHDRTKVVAAEVLGVIGDDPNLLHKLTPVLPQLVKATAQREPRWANMGAVRAKCADIIARLAEVEELPESISRREEATSYVPLLRREGVLEAMLALLYDSDRAAQGHAARVLDVLIREDLEGAGTAVLEAEPPPKIGSTPGTGMGAVANFVELDAAKALGLDLASVTPAAATVPMAPGAEASEAGPGPGSDADAKDDGVTSKGLGTLVEIIRSGDVVGRAAAAGCITQLCGMGAHVLREASALGAVPALTSLLTPPKAEGGGKKKKAPAVPPEVMRGIINAAGALRLMSFDDSIKHKIMTAGAVEGLAKLVEMKGKKWNLNMDAYNHAVGCLYNLAQDKRNTETLKEAGLPPHLVHPFPAAWLCDPDSDDEGGAGPHATVLRGRLPGLKPLDMGYGMPDSRPSFGEERVSEWHFTN